MLSILKRPPRFRLLQTAKSIQRLLLKQKRVNEEQASCARWFGCSACLWSKQADHDGTINKPDIDMSKFPVENVRNFSIIAHVDHGKSTLADRLLEVTGVISKSTKNEQVLDLLQVERERGITVKAVTASLLYTYKGTTYLLNLIDTPGHVDFNYEVARSLSACQGVILLVDANQGVQAQTVANFYLAFEQDLTIIPVMNKIDLKVAKPDEVLEQLKNVFDIEPEEVLKVSAKLGIGIDEVLKAIIEKIPPPTSDVNKPLRCLMFDSTYDQYRGAVPNVVVVDGVLRKGDKVQSMASKKVYEVQEVGIMRPSQEVTNVLYAGQMGYLLANMKNVKEAMVGDTITHKGSDVTPLPGFKPARPMVFAGIYPMEQSQFSALRIAIDKLLLNDSSVDARVDHSQALGQGWRIGFLGLLHMDVFTTRLDQEFGYSVIVTTPNVPYKVTVFGAKNIKFYGGEELTILNPCKLPDPSMIKEYYEPMVHATVIAPDEYISEICDLFMQRRGTFPEQNYMDQNRVIFKSTVPLNEILVDFFDELKSLSSGYASFDYEDAGYVLSDLVKVDYLIEGKTVEELTMIAHKSRARALGTKICAKLKQNIPRHLFRIMIQASVGRKIVAREDIKANRKDVTAKCYGGDITRKKKLLDRQREGKKKMRLIGHVEVPKDAFLKILQK